MNIWLIAVAIVLYIAVIPKILQWLWNITIPQLFELKEITYWQSFRLIIIVGILTGATNFNYVVHR